jgi:hypothetical protein
MMPAHQRQIHLIQEKANLDNQQQSSIAAAGSRWEQKIISLKEDFRAL